MEGEVIIMNADIVKQRSYFVVKDNALIQKTRYALSVQQQKLLLFMVSKIKPMDEPYTEYTISIGDYCRACGVDHDNGGNYAYMKASLKSIADKSIWMKMGNGKEILLRWLDRVVIDEHSGTVQFSFHRDMHPYLLNLHSRYTQDSLMNVLPMRSAYSIRLYELLRSYVNMETTITMMLDEFKRRIGGEVYERFSNLKQKVIDPAVAEINMYSDIEVEYKAAKVAKSRSYNQISFYITSKAEAGIPVYMENT